MTIHVTCAWGKFRHLSAPAGQLLLFFLSLRFSHYRSIPYFSNSRNSITYTVALKATGRSSSQPTSSRSCPAHRQQQHKAPMQLPVPKLAARAAPCHQSAAFLLQPPFDDHHTASLARDIPMSCYTALFSTATTTMTTSCYSPTIVVAIRPK